MPKVVEVGRYDALRPLARRLQGSDEISPRDARSECRYHIGYLIADHKRRDEIYS